MHGLGEYVVDRTEGISRIEDLPRPNLVQQSRNYSHRDCPRCGKSYRDKTCTLPDVGDPIR